MVTINGKEIPKIHLEMIDDSATTIKLSEIFGDFRIIPLETKKESMISYPGKICITNHSVLTWTQVGIGPCRVLEFDLNGKFIREFGGGGKGPGEHTGYFVDELTWFPDLKEIFISFNGVGGEDQLFGEDGRFLNRINNPVDLTQGMKRFNDSIWMVPGELAGTVDYRRDSIRLLLFSASGRELKVWPRNVYLPTGKTGYSPGGWGCSLYQFQNLWKIYSPGDDTLYQVGPDRLDPVAILNPGPKGQPFNQFTEPSRTIGNCMYQIIKETKDKWYLDKKVMTKAELQGSGNFWSGMVDFNEFLLVIDKKTGVARNIRFTDDFLGITPERITRHLVQWTENGEPYLAFTAIDLKESIKASLKKKDLDPKIRGRLELLDKQVTIDSNPVFVLFSLL